MILCSVWPPARHIFFEVTRWKRRAKKQKKKKINKNNTNAGDTVNLKCFIITTFCELRIEQLCLLIGSQNCAPVSIYYARMVAERHWEVLRNTNCYRCCLLFRWSCNYAKLSSELFLGANYYYYYTVYHRRGSNVVKIYDAYSRQKFALSSFFNIKKIWHGGDWLSDMSDFNFFLFHHKMYRTLCDVVVVAISQWNWNDGEVEISEQ